MATASASSPSDLSSPPLSSIFSARPTPSPPQPALFSPLSAAVFFSKPKNAGSTRNPPFSAPSLSSNPNPSYANPLAATFSACPDEGRVANRIPHTRNPQPQL